MLWTNTTPLSFSKNLLKYKTMKKFIKFITKIFFTVAILSSILYFTLLHFEKKVQEEYTLLIQHSQKMLQVFLDKKNADLYILCILDYHINPNGKKMLNKCSKIENIHKEYPELNTKLETPYYDFYMKYIQGAI